MHSYKIDVLIKSLYEENLKRWLEQVLDTVESKFLILEVEKEKHRE